MYNNELKQIEQAQKNGTAFVIRPSKNVRIHHMENNSGQAAVREWGIRHATGEYLIHCDSDDWTDKRMYEIMYQTEKKTNADIVFCDYPAVMPQS